MRCRLSLLTNSAQVRGEGVAGPQLLPTINAAWKKRTTIKKTAFFQKKVLRPSSLNAQCNQRWIDKCVFNERVYCM
jgi:hypothetical protein